MLFHASSIAQVTETLQTSTDRGLSPDTLSKQEAVYGKNILPSANERVRRLAEFFGQFKSPLIFILLAAGTVSGIVGKYSDMGIIFATAVLNACIGFFQEDKANRALQRLQTMVEQKVMVIRSGEKRSILSQDLVPGDVILLAAGDKVPADARIIEAVQLEMNEAPLTGESLPVKKQDVVLSETTSLADRVNMVYRGTTVVNGRGRVVVTSIGAETEIGKIATMVRETSEEATPLQHQLSRLSRQLGLVVVIISFGIIILGLFQSSQTYGLVELFQTAVAVSVAAIPEGLVISLTVILAIGMQYILQRRALVRRLLAAETLGSVSVICTDKTGTLTEGSMRVTRLRTRTADVDHEGFTRMVHQNTDEYQDELLALRIGTLCNDTTLQKNQSTGEEVFLGDTTEIALSLVGKIVGYDQQSLERTMPRIGEIPFSSDTKFMVTVHEVDHEWLWYIKGAPEVLLSRATHYEENGVLHPITEDERAWWRDREMEMASAGLRVLAVAYATTPKEQRHLGSLTAKDIPESTFVGLFGFSDPVRADVPETVRQAQEAGIRIVMITGDHASTARAVAREIGIGESPTSVLEGADLESMSQEELVRRVKDVTVYARVSPHHKIRIVEAFQAHGDVVAMTGDGVNDAPALKGADIGVSVGSGTDVAKETADLVLLDDSFSTIVAAVEEGRRIYQNIRKVILYLLVGSLSEVSLIVACIIFKLPLALLPVQILWVNIIQETFPTMALAFDAGDEKNMSDPPRKKNAPLLDRHMKVLIAMMMLIINTLLFALFVWYLKKGETVSSAQTAVFAALSVSGLFYIYSIRSHRHPVWRINPFDNIYLTVSLAFGWIMLMMSLYVPWFNQVLHTVPISAREWLVIIGFGIVNVACIEIGKVIVFKKR